MPLQECIASIDAGTTSVRCMVFDQYAQVLASHQLEFTQYFTHPGWQEQDADEIVAACHTCIEQAMSRLPKEKYAVKVVGITNQRETTVVWDRKTGKPLTRAIAWPDTRTTGTVRELAKKSSKGTDAVKQETGLPLSTYFAAVKLRWMLDNLPEVKSAHDAGEMMFGTVDSWLLYNFTGGKDGGVHMTDSSNASRTMFMDLRKQTWDPALCDFFGIDQKVLPEIRSSSEVYGKFKTGPLDGIPIGGILGDQMAALVGNKCFQPGEAKNTYGTGAFLLYNTGTQVVSSDNGLLSTIAYKAGPNAPVHYALEGSIAVAGSAIKWVRDSLQLIKNAEEIGPLAAQVDDAGGVYFVTAFSGLFCPYWDDSAAGTIVVSVDSTCRYSGTLISSLHR